MLTDTIADTLTRIRNAQRVGHKTVNVRCSSMVENLLKVLRDEGFVEGYDKTKDAKGKFDEYQVSLKYFANGEPVVSEATRVSRPGRRVYAKSGDLPQVHKGLGIAVISTSQGVLPDRIARKNKVGGEILAYIN